MNKKKELQEESNGVEKVKNGKIGRLVRVGGGRRKVKITKERIGLGKRAARRVWRKVENSRT